MKKLLKIVAILVGVLVVLIAAGVGFVMVKLPDAEPAPDLRIEATPELIARGEYLAKNVSLCFVCHSQTNRELFAAPIVPGSEGQGADFFGERAEFPGKVYARNITPAGIGDWTDGELFRAITAGIDKNGDPLFPIMPYPAYRHMASEDVEAIIAYLRTLPAKEGESRKSEFDFPLNLIVRMMPQPYTEKSRPAPSDTLAYGKYLAKIAACQLCHTPTDGQGNPLPGKTFAGGEEFPDKSGIIRSANITPDMQTGIGSWSKAYFIQRFKTYQKPELREIPLREGLNPTEMPWYSYAGMTEEDLAAIYAYLRTVPAVKNTVEKYTPASK